MKIKKFEFIIGGYFGSNYSLKYKKGIFRYRANDLGSLTYIELPPKNWNYSKVKNNEQIQFDSNDEDLIIKQEKLIQFFKYVSRYYKSWNKEFVNEDILHSIGWECDIWIDDFILKSNGQNEYSFNFN